MPGPNTGVIINFNPHISIAQDDIQQGSSESPSHDLGTTQSRRRQQHQQHQRPQPTNKRRRHRNWAARTRVQDNIAGLASRLNNLEIGRRQLPSPSPSPSPPPRAPRIPPPTARQIELRVPQSSVAKMHAIMRMTGLKEADINEAAERLRISTQYWQHEPRERQEVGTVVGAQALVLRLVMMGMGIARGVIAGEFGRADVVVWNMMVEHILSEEEETRRALRGNGLSEVQREIVRVVIL